MLNKNVSLDSYFLPSPLFLSFFCFLIFLFTFLSFTWESIYVHSFIYGLWNKSFQFVSFLFWKYIYIYNFQYLVRVEGKRVLSCTYLFERFSSQVSFFYGRAAFLYNLAEGPFCYLLSKDSILLFPGAWLTWRPSLANVCPELKILFQISSDEKVLFFFFFGAKGSANHLALLSLCHPVKLLQWPTFPSPSNQL